MSEQEEDSKHSNSLSAVGMSRVSSQCRHIKHERVMRRTEEMYRSPMSLGYITFSLLGLWTTLNTITGSTSPYRAWLRLNAP